MFIPVGARLDLLSNMMVMAKRTWPGRPAFTVVTSGEKQSQRSRNSYAVYIPTDSQRHQVLAS